MLALYNHLQKSVPANLIKYMSLGDIAQVVEEDKLFQVTPNNIFIYTTDTSASCGSIWLLQVLMDLDSLKVLDY